jgi:hypothetical protein
MNIINLLMIMNLKVEKNFLVLANNCFLKNIYYNFLLKILYLYYKKNN